MCWKSQPTINRRPRRRQERTQREMGRAMVNREQIVLVVSDDAALCAAARREFEASIAGLRVASVTSVAAARGILEEDAPAVILLEEAGRATGNDGTRGVIAPPRGAGARPARDAPAARSGGGAKAVGRSGGSE